VGTGATDGALAFPFSLPDTDRAVRMRREQGMEATGITGPEKLTADIKTQIERWRKIVDEKGGLKRLTSCSGRTTSCRAASATRHARPVGYGTVSVCSISSWTRRSMSRALRPACSGLSHRLSNSPGSAARSYNSPKLESDITVIR
jgi:hypothetical protein